MRKAFKKYENPKFSGLTIDFYRIFTYIYRGMPYLNGRCHKKKIARQTTLILTSLLSADAVMYCILRGSSSSCGHAHMTTP